MLERINVFNNHIMRWMCGARLRDKNSIAILRANTGVKPIIPIIKARKVKWYGHIKRSDLLVKVTLEGMVAGKEIEVDQAGDGETISAIGVMTT